jgi:hypothetical protein
LKRVTNILQIIKKVSLKTIRYTLLLIFVLFAVLQLDTVQTYIAQKLAQELTEKIGHQISIEKVSIRWFDLARVEGIHIEDLQGEEMISIESAMIDYRLSSLMNTNKVIIDYIEVYRPHLLMNWYKGGDNINFNIFIKKIRETLAPTTKKKKSAKPIVITSGRVIDGVYGFNNENKGLIDFDGFDHFHFQLDSINGDVSDLYIFKDTVQLSGRNITALYKTRNFHIYSLNTDFRYTKHTLEFHKIDADLGSSHLSKDLVFTYKDMSDFSQFNRKVKINTQLDSTVISTQDLALFVPSLKKIKDHWTAYGNIKGKVSNFQSKNLSFYFGRHSKIHGGVGLDGLPNIAETFIEFNLENSVIFPEDIQQYMKSDKHYLQIKKFGKIDFSARFNGFPSQFTTNGKFNTDLGFLKMDIQFKINPDLKRSEYEGELFTDEFQLGVFLDNNSIGKINLDGKVAGYGFTIDEAQLDMNAEVLKFEFLGYPYQGIDINGRLENKYFKGQFSIEDPNLRIKSKGEVDFRESNQKIILLAEIEEANMRALHLTEDSLFLSTTLDLDFNGFSIDEVIGKGHLKETFISQNDKKLLIDNFKFSSTKKDSIRDFSLQSNLISFFARGDFEFTNLTQDLELLLKEYELKLSNDQNEIDNYYSLKEQGDNYEIRFKLNLTNTKPLFDLFYPAVTISKGTILKGRFSNSRTSVLEIHSSFDSIKIDNITLSKNEIDLFTSKKRYSNDVLASYSISSEKQKIGIKSIAKDFYLSGLWDNTAFTYNSSLSSLGNKNGYKLNGDVQFTDDSTIFKIYNSNFKIDNHQLSVVDTNLIGLKGKHIAFEHFELKDHFNNQKHILFGDINNDSSTATLSLDDFNLNYISLFAKTELHGSYTGDITLSDFYENPTISSVFKLDSFGMYDGTFGNFDGNINWNLEDRQINIDVDLHNDSLKLAEISGYINTDRKVKTPLNLTLDLNEIPLNIIEPFIKGQVSHIQGNATGKVKILGDFIKPDFFGHPTIVDGGMTVEYLKTHYKFENNIYFKNDTITFQNIVLLDTLEKTKATLNGYIRHSLFNRFYVDATIKLEKTLLQNTKKEDNEIYYGPIYATGDINIKGPFEELIIHSDEVTSEKGTSITIPLDSEGAITKADFIHFIDKDKMKDDFEIFDHETKVNFNGVSINLNMNLTEDALIDIIFDEKAGDRLTGYGKGLLLIDLNTKGDFNMYGNYEISKGSYSFSMLSLLNKSFSIETGSKIEWSGDPYGGKMDVIAKYSVMTNVIPIINDTAFVSSHPDVKRANPVDVSLGMKGNLMAPSIKFGITIEEYPNYIEVEQAILDFKNRIKYNEQELNKQVFSLIVFKKLSPLDNFDVNISSTAGASVSEMFSNQLGYMLSQLDEDLDVYIDLGSFDNDGSSLNVRLSYSVMDGRLRISHNGNYSNYEGNQDLKNLFGEWTVEYLLSDDGKVRIKGYNKLNQNTASTSLSSQNSTVYGVAIAYNDNYDTFSEFWTNLKDKFKNDAEIDNEKPLKDKRLENLGL